MCIQLVKYRVRAFVSVKGIWLHAVEGTKGLYESSGRALWELFSLTCVREREKEVKLVDKNSGWGWLELSVMSVSLSLGSREEQLSLAQCATCILRRCSFTCGSVLFTISILLSSHLAFTVSRDSSILYTRIQRGRGESICTGAIFCRVIRPLSRERICVYCWETLAPVAGSPWCTDSERQTPSNERTEAKSERESECLRWNSKKKKTERWENVRKRITTWLKVSRDRHSLVTSYLIHSLILFSRLIIHFVNFDRCHTVSTLSHSLQQMFPLSPQATVREIERKKSTPLVCTVAHATLVAPNTEKLYQVWNRKTTFIANRCTVNFIVNNFIRRRCLHCVFTTLQCTVIVSQRALISSTL